MSDSEGSHHNIAIPSRLLCLYGQRNASFVPVRKVVVAHADADAFLFPVQSSIRKSGDHHRWAIIGRRSPAINMHSIFRIVAEAWLLPTASLTNVQI